MDRNQVRHSRRGRLGYAISKTIGTIIKRKDSRLFGAPYWRCLGLFLIFAACFGLRTVALADGTDVSTNAPDVSTNTAPTTTPAPASLLRPILSTNTASSTFLQIHPELAEPTPGDRSSLSLHPETTANTVPPEVIPPGTGIFPETVQPPNPMAETGNLADHLLVVYNTNDPDSQGLAQYYATKRNIPAERVLAISCSDSEEITREQFDDSIRSPIVSYLCQKDWMAREPQTVRVGDRILNLLVATRNDIWAIVLMRGVPLKIAPDPSDEDSMEYQPQFQVNAAAVDNELALLPVFGLPNGGFVPNIFFDDQISGIKRVGPELARNMVMVTRLDGPTPADVRRMIDDSFYAEHNRLAGLAVIDSRGLTDHNDYTVADIWLRNARDMLVQDGWHVKFDDKPDVLPATDPCNHVALYLGWYHEGAVGPWVTLPNRFVPGAIAYHLHSYSATTVRSDTVGWVGPLIAHGADATMGMVYEPYVELTPHEDIFTRRLLQGDYFAEAAYASEPALSWMLTVVGDPLYRPFRQPLDAVLEQASTPHTPHDDWMLLQKVGREIATCEMAATTQNLTQALDVPGAGPVAEEGLGDLLENVNEPAARDATVQAYKKALAGETTSIDRIRVGLKLAQYYGKHGMDAQAQSELSELRKFDPIEARRFGVLDSPVPASIPSEPPTVNNKPERVHSPPGLARLPSPPTPTPVSQ